MVQLSVNLDARMLLHRIGNDFSPVLHVSRFCVCNEASTSRWRFQTRHAHPKRTEHFAGDVLPVVALFREVQNLLTELAFDGSETAMLAPV